MLIMSHIHNLIQSLLELKSLQPNPTSPTLFMQVPALEILHHAQEFDLGDCAVWINVPCSL